MDHGVSDPPFQVVGYDFLGRLAHMIYRDKVQSRKYH